MKKVIHIIALLFGMLAAVRSADYHQQGFLYIFPQPGSTEVSRLSTVIVRFAAKFAGAPVNLQQLVVVKNKSGALKAGRVKLASDGRTAIFQPDKSFTAGERFFVRIDPAAIGLPNISPLNYSFQVSLLESSDIKPAEPAVSRLRKKTVATGEAQIMPNGVSVPGDYPHVEVEVNDQPAPGYVFVNNWGDPSYNLILDPDGSPIWYQRTPDERRDFKVQKNGLLTMLVRDGYPFGQGYVALDQTYAEVDSFYAVNGYSTDEHELQVLENGNYLLIGVRGMTVDMSQIVAGGQKNARITESGFQEFTPDGEMIFQWRAWDNFDPADMIGFSDDLPTDNSFRFPHMNSIDIDDDGHIILSSKRLSEVTKIDRQTGEIIWRLGGANNQFEFVNDPLGGFSMQHSVSALGDGHYTVFDNGVFHNPQVSRALEYQLDTQNMTATLVWNFVEKPPTYAFHMGNVQRLPNGNTFINWAVENLPKGQEIRPDGSVVYKMNFVDGYKSYRAFKFPWQGVAPAPVLYVEQQVDNVACIFNKFGDANVAYYKIYAGRGLNPTTVVATSTTTLAKLANLENKRRYFIRVTAVDKNGAESDFSNQEEIVVNMITPGTEMVSNGDFAAGKDNWDWLVRNGAQANWSVTDGVALIDISNGGNTDSDIQLTQAGKALVLGREYNFEFDAWAESPRTIEAKIAQNGGAFTDYSRVGITALARAGKRFAYRFRMQSPTDVDARIVFNAGGDMADVHLANISLKMVGETGVVSNSTTPAGFQLLGNYPNPFNGQTTIRFALAGKSDVRLLLFNLLGEQVKEVNAGLLSPGGHAINLAVDNLASGVYLYRIAVSNNAGAVAYSLAKKMTLLR